MGCDIHFYIEHYYKDKWHCVKEPSEFRPEWDKDPNIRWYIGRSYHLFGLLAGVRSNVLPTPIAPRGFPEDASVLVKREFKKWGSDAHTPSYILLTELLDFENIIIDQPIYLSPPEYKNFLNNSNNLDINCLYERDEDNIISFQELEKISNLLAFTNDDTYLYKYAKIDNVKLPLISFINNNVIWKDVVPKMKKLNKDPSKVRCVFWFDN